MTDRGGIGHEEWIPYLWEQRRANPEDMEVCRWLAEALEDEGDLVAAAAQFAALGDDVGRSRVLETLASGSALFAPKWRRAGQW